jgi:hypothetical protein
MLMAESALLEPIVMDTIERYFDLLQAHVSASEMIEKVLTEDFETGFTDGFHWRGADGLAEFLEARSVFFDESHDVLQLMDVTRPDEHNIQARTRLWFFLRGHQPGAAESEEFTGQVKNSPDRCGTPGGCGANRLRADGEWRHKSSRDLLS